LVGGAHLTIPCALSKNGYSVDTHPLADSGANGFVFIDSSFAINIAKFFQLKAQRLPEPIHVKGYDGQSSKSVTHVLRLHLTVDGRRLLDLPLLILDLGTHDLILGRKWFDHLNILVNCRNRCLEWPLDRKPSYSAVRDIPIAREVLCLRSGPDRQYDNEIATREAAFMREDERRASGQQISSFQPTILHRTHRSDTKDSLKRMTEEVTNTVRPKMEPYKKKIYIEAPRGQSKPQTVDIAAIGAIGIHFNMKVPENEVFITSLHEIECRIQELKSDPEEEEDWDEAVRKVLPEEYWPYIDAFSKVESDKLPPHRSYDHRIELTENNRLSFSPLYKMTAEELEIVKQYLIDNLAKGFIEPSQAPWASPVLFVSKPNGGLRFCIDFRKLNEITRKDQYPLPLIDETLARIGKAKVFTKLDIRQAFHRIRIDPESEELTTFRTRYGSYKCKVVPFGLTNGPATYQRYMNDILFDYLDDFATAYLDDILIYSEDPKEHATHVKKVLQRLRDAGLQVDIKKCEFKSR
jgi:predicted aspartyl protease